MSGGAERVVWLSGRFVPERRARILATSPSVMHGLGAFETLRIVAGEAPLLALHVERLAATCRALGLSPHRGHACTRTISTLAARNGIRSGVARLTVGADFTLATCAPLPRGLRGERTHGVSLTTLRLQRGTVHMKTTSWLPLWLAERRARGEVLLQGERGQLLESSRSNLFVVTERGLVTAPVPEVLPGIARGLVLELARAEEVPVAERAPLLRERARWREVFLTNAVRGIRPVRAIDGRAIPVPGPCSLTRRMQRALDQRMRLRGGRGGPAPRA